jgi:hypothetical protein
MGTCQSRILKINSRFRVRGLHILTGCKISLSNSTSLGMIHLLMSLMTNFGTTFSDFVREMGSRAVFGVQTPYYHWDSVLFGGLYEYVGEGREKVMSIFTSTVTKVHCNMVTFVPLFRKSEKSKISKVNYIITIRNATTHIAGTSTRTHDQRLLLIPIHTGPMLT